MASRVCGLEELVRHPQVLTVGEAGLDKLADAPMDLQVEVFRCRHVWQRKWESRW